MPIYVSVFQSTVNSSFIYNKHFKCKGFYSPGFSSKVLAAHSVSADFMLHSLLEQIDYEDLCFSVRAVLLAK